MAAKKKNADSEEPTFESSLKELEQAVDKLEQGNLPLSEALKLFENGLKASNVCRERLEEAKQKVEVLVKDAGGDFSLSDLDGGEDETSPDDDDEVPF